MKRIAVIMAGGAGERFWPVSRQARPKQLLRLAHPELSLLEEAVARVGPLFGDEGIYISTGRSVEAPIRASGVVSATHIWVEPAKRNTLGALCWVAAQLLAEGRSDVSMAILTADHRIGPAEAFRAQVCLALDVAEERGALVTFGIRPERPETGFGYIEFDADTEGPEGVFRARSFREKPDLETAEEFLRRGNFLWNSGMFFWTLESFLKALAASQPEAHRLTLAIAEALNSGKPQVAEALFNELPNISVDYGVMEHAENVAVVRSSFNWDDLGSWDALQRSLELDEAGNVVYGNAVVLDSSGCVVYNDGDASLVTVLGLEDVLVVATKDAIMVCPKSEAQRVKQIVERIKSDRPDLT